MTSLPQPSSRQRIENVVEDLRLGWGHLLDSPPAGTNTNVIARQHVIEEFWRAIAQALCSESSGSDGREDQKKESGYFLREFWAYNALAEFIVKTSSKCAQGKGWEREGGCAGSSLCITEWCAPCLARIHIERLAEAQSISRAVREAALASNPNHPPQITPT